MDIHKFYPEQEPQPEELDEAFVDTAFNISKRFGVITQPGIVPAATLYALTRDLRWQSLMPQGTEFKITQNGAFAFDVGPGMAFNRSPISSAGTPQDVTNPVDLRMERVLITPTAAGVTYNAANPLTQDGMGNLTPISTGTKAIPVLPQRVYYVYVRYLQCVDTLSTGGSVNKYSMEPETGDIGYTHWVDGYQIVTYSGTPSSDPADIYLATIITGVSAITSIATAGRSYLNIPGSFVASEVRSTQLSPFILRPTAYGTDMSVTFSDHINAVSDLTGVTLGNPHGMTMGNIPGLLDRFGIYSDQPEDFFTNGIIDNTLDLSSQRPGPYWAAVQGANVMLQFPVVGQSIAIDRYLYDASSTYYAQVSNGVSLVLQLSGASAYCQFPSSMPSLRPTGYYFVYGERAPYTDVPGLAIKAVYCGPAATALLTDMLDNPQNYLTIATQYPFAIVNFDSPTGAFIPFTADPQTGYNATSFNCLDVRRYGTISEFNLSHDRRAYTDSDSEMPQLGILKRNDTMYSDQIKWEISGAPAVVTNKPVRQDMVKKVGRIRRVTVYSDTVPLGSSPSNGLIINVTKNGIGNSIFSTAPKITSARAANAVNYAGATGAVLMSITEQNPAGADIGKIDSAANLVNPGDRLQLTIASTGAPGFSTGGNDLVVMVYIE